jgi:hypothetical protein
MGKSTCASTLFAALANYVASRFAFLLAFDFGMLASLTSKLMDR